MISDMLFCSEFHVCVSLTDSSVERTHLSDAVRGCSALLFILSPPDIDALATGDLRYYWQQQKRNLHALLSTVVRTPRTHVPVLIVFSKSDWESFLTNEDDAARSESALKQSVSSQLGLKEIQEKYGETAHRFKVTCFDHAASPTEEDVHRFERSLKWLAANGPSFGFLCLFPMPTSC